MLDLDNMSNQNMRNLRDNPYPGRGIVLGESPDGQSLIQVYWIMGRSANSRNRIFESENGAVKTKAYDESNVEDPSLIIYYPARVVDNNHIITNGDQTDTIAAHLQNGKSFEGALYTRTFEPDAPNYTPRISGITYLDGSQFIYKLSILKSSAHDPNYCERHFFDYEKAIPGIGHCISTYAGDGNPLPTFSGEPYPVKLFNSIGETSQFYWKLLSKENIISLMVKFIDQVTKKSTLKILNKNLGD